MGDHIIKTYEYQQRVNIKTISLEAKFNIIIKIIRESFIINITLRFQ